MIDNTKLYTSYPLFIAIDGEGRDTDAVAAAGLGTKVDTPQSIGATGDTNNAYIAGTTVGTYLAELGFNLDFAPSADLSVVDGNAAGSSSYGSEVDNVASFVGYMQAGLQEQKVTACIGQFPGIGSSTQSTKDGMGEHEKTARWYYYSAMAHMGLGNNVAALEHANKAVALDPQNMEYQMLLQRLQSGGQWYESRQAAYGYPHVGGNDLCLKICLANLFCNLCCGGGGLCFGGYGGRGMF